MTSQWVSITKHVFLIIGSTQHRVTVLIIWHQSRDLIVVAVGNRKRQTRRQIIYKLISARYSRYVQWQPRAMANLVIPNGQPSISCISQPIILNGMFTKRKAAIRYSKRKALDIDWTCILHNPEKCMKIYSKLDSKSYDNLYKLDKSKISCTVLVDMRSIENALLWGVRIRDKPARCPDIEARGQWSHTWRHNGTKLLGEEENMFSW